ncbi:MAG TPA: hypothetical protein VIJ43_11220, partial [Burkholderiales bacterium]
MTHPFADFLPSFWAEGLLRALGFLFSSVRFSFWDWIPAVRGGPDGGLIFINICVSTPRYGASMAR